jgi:tetratricopeptide (TPR) repeat protein
VRRRAEAAGAALLIACLLPAAARAKVGTPDQVYRLVQELRIAEAEAQLAPLVAARPNDPDIAFLDGNVRFHRGDYAGAAARFAEAAQKERRGPLGQEIREMKELAEATLDATAGFEKKEGRHFVVHHAPGKDAVLVPWALEALDKAWEALGADFGDRPAEKVRVEIYPEVADLAKVSTLTLEEIETSGTIAICKFNRLMIVSPRALIAGYPWIDTLTHEYTHFIISRTSHNTVPIWLHEGLAKYEERRWRGPGGGGLSPTMESLLATALAKKRLITFEQMHPSMAKLPSQEDTALAFAEVYTVIEYLTQQVGWDGIRRVIGEMREGKSDAQAIAAVLGRSFADFQRDWRGWLAGRKLKARPGLLPQALRFRKNPGKRSEASEDDSHLIAEDKAKKLARLGGLLRTRNRLRAAAMEYEKAQAILGPGHPQVAARLARTYFELGDYPHAVATATPAVEAYPDQAGPQATLGQSHLKRGDHAQAEKHLLSALALNPFDPALHCGLAEIYEKRGRPEAARTREACRTLGGR